jgi:hypothetical protein
MGSCNNFRLMSSAIILSMLSLTSCSSLREQPHLNPNPKYYLILKGHITEKLRNQIKLRFIQDYVGANPKCASESDPISGIMENPAKSITHLAEPDVNGNYEIRVPLDKYLPGYCNWQSWSMGIALTDEEHYYEPDGLAFVNYSNTESIAKSSNFYNYICPKKVNNSDTGDNCDLVLLPGRQIPNYIRTNHSSKITVNVSYKGETHAHNT